MNPNGRSLSSHDSPRLDTLDILRIIAAILVLLNHFGLYGVRSVGFAREGEGLAYPALAIFIGVGAVGLQAFFVISGLVISLTAERFLARGDYKGFMLARAIRLLPVLWLSASLAAAALLLTGTPFAQVLNMLGRTIVLSPAGPYVDGVVWSLVVEIIFYGLIAIAITRRSQNSLSLLMYALGSVSIVFLAIRVIALLGGLDGLSSFLERYAFRLLLLEHGVYFSLGMLLWKTRARPNQLHFRAFGGVLYAACIAQICLGPEQSKIALLATLTIFTLFLYVIKHAVRPTRAQTRIPGSSYLGRLSYPLYLNHLTLGSAISAWFIANGSNPITAFALTITMILILCHGMLNIERRVQGQLKQRSSQSSKVYRNAN